MDDLERELKEEDAHLVAICQKFLSGELDKLAVSQAFGGPPAPSSKPTEEAHWVSLGDSVGSALTMAETGEEIGIPVPYPSLRAFRNDFSKGGLFVVSGYTGHGKTAFALNLALRVAEENRVSIISMEMNKEELAFRALGLVSGVPINDIRTNSVMPGVQTDLERARAEASTMMIDFAVAPRGTMTFVENAIRKDPPDLLMVDHLHLMTAGDKNSRVQDVGDMARRFKLLAMELNIPVILLAQLRKVPAGQTIKRPGLDDLRESAEIQQSADAVFFVYQKDVGGDTMEVIIDKNRGGSVGSVDMHWEPQLTRVTDPVENFRENH